MPDSSADVTQLLVDWSNGDRQAADRLLPLVYDELRRRAAAYFQRERTGQTLQATALVHEAYLRLVDQRSVRYRNRLHFFALAAKLMRRILVDHARGHLSAKRGGDVPRLALDEALEVSADRPEYLVAVDDALAELQKSRPELGRLVELRFFGGFKNEELAELLEISIPTITRRWQLARAWLYRRLTEPESDGG